MQIIGWPSIHLAIYILIDTLSKFKATILILASANGIFSAPTEGELLKW